MKISLLQMKTAATPAENILKIKEMLRKAKKEGADMAVLPEMCCCPYENSAFVQFAMPYNSSFLTEIKETAKELELYIVAGSVPLAEKKKIYNASFVYNTKGECLCTHKKVHLFDINVTGGQYFMESDTFTAGKEATTFDTPWGRFGLMICYDIRFPELARITSHPTDPYKNTVGIIVPAAFNMTTGPAHWELSFRMRALDNQVFMIGCAPARDINASYQAWGHSIVADPWGSILGQLDETEGILTVELNLDRVDQVREQLPLLKHRRTDLYRIESYMGMPSEQMGILSSKQKETAKHFIKNVLGRDSE